MIAIINPELWYDEKVARINLIDYSGSTPDRANATI
jgi:hypothetical protein